MKKYLPLILLVFTLNAESIYAQITLTNGDHTIEINGAISTYYNHRFLKEGELNRRKNRFNLRDAQLQIEGRYKRDIEYELQVDFSDLGQAATGLIDPENPGIMDAFVRYKGLKVVDITFGYTKLPYSRSSLVPFIYTPYWQRAEIVRGDIFSRRDVGVSLGKTFWRQRINIVGGVYTGLGELSLRGDNDPSGNLEYVGRAEFAYPSRFRYRDIDDRITPVPMVAVGVNGRYTDKRQPVPNRTLPSGAGGEYGIKVIDGIKYVYGFDMALQWMGFSAQYEFHFFRATPRDSNNFMLLGLPKWQTGGFFQGGGLYGQLNYFSKPLKSIFSARYEELMLNDLIAGRLVRFGGAYAYQLNGWKSMLKVQYWLIDQEDPMDEKRWKSQIRIGWQYLFQ